MAAASVPEAPDLSHHLGPRATPCGAVSILGPALPLRQHSRSVEGTRQGQDSGTEQVPDEADRINQLQARWPRSPFEKQHQEAKPVALGPSDGELQRHPVTHSDLGREGRWERRVAVPGFWIRVTVGFSTRQSCRSQLRSRAEQSPRPAEQHL